MKRGQPAKPIVVAIVEKPIHMYFKADDEINVLLMEKNSVKLFANFPYVTINGVNKIVQPQNSA